LNKEKLFKWKHNKSDIFILYSFKHKKSACSTIYKNWGL